jgi:succinate dehydrogenase/fumarate reductase-like Fe-S protein
MKEEMMKRIILTALITCLAVGTASAQSCDSKAVGATGKPLHGAAKMSFVKKCKRDACGSKAVSAEGKPLHGAAKNSFMAKCMRSA